jgi:hypothetical protein
MAHRPVTYFKAAGAGFIPAKSGTGFLSVWFAGYEPSQAKAFENSGIPATRGHSSTLNSMGTFRVALADATIEFDFCYRQQHLVKGKPMRKAAVVFSAAAVTVMTAVSIPTPVEARGGGGWGPGIAGGLIAGALIGGLAYNAYGYGPGYGYYGPGPYGYYGGYAPAYYGGYAPAYYGYGYGRPYYGYRRVYYRGYRPAYYRPYYGPRFYGAGW